MPLPVLVAACLVLAAFAIRRDATTWGLAWLCLAVAAALDALGPDQPTAVAAATFAGSLFPFMMLYGALRFARRTRPEWAIGLGLVFATLRTVLGSQRPTTALEMASIADPAIIVLAATVAGWHAWSARARFSDQLVGPALLLLAGIEAYAGYRQLHDQAPAQWGTWLIFVVPAVVAQFYAAIRQSTRARTAATEALATNEARFRRLAEHSDTLISELGPDGRLVYASPNHSLLGLDPSDIVGRRPDELAHLMEAQPSEPGWDQAAAESTFGALSKVRTPTGEIRWFDSRSTTSIDADGKRHILSIARDVTDRIRAQQAESKNRERLRLLLSSLPRTRVTVIGRDLHVRALVPPEQDFENHGLKWSEVEGQRLDRFLSEEQFEQWKSLVEEVYSTGETREVRQRLRLGGGVQWYETILTPFEGDDGEEDVVLAVTHDITEQVRVETERRDFENRLQQAQKFESLGLLASGIAHDFNNLLVGITGNVELAQRAASHTPEVEPRLRDIATAARRAAELTQQLLAYAGKADLLATPVDLTELVTETVQLLRPTAPEGVEIRLESAAVAPWVEADATQVRQVVMNLLTNALEAIEGTGARVVARAGTMRADRPYLDACHPAGRMEPGSYSYVEVEDDGPGMDAETRARVFEPFFSSRGLGRGLGLAVVLGVVKSHGGTVHVDSQRGRGTRMRVLFPPTAPAPREAEVPKLDTPAEPRGTILVVDDEDSVRSVARAFLELGGYSVVEASNGPEALRLFRERPEAFQAALLDISMPEMGGDETLAALRSVRDDLPVLFMSGHSAADLKQHGNGSALVGHLRKPFGIGDLETAMHDLRTQ